uniref:Uncharacterized protein n=1 Tax=Physcomitrium patens TaxID=3218 RepID=A0A2K1JUE5_PHYPA|nr:hypothetical protein PHYPA_014918 [Physcomitrium patens]
MSQSGKPSPGLDLLRERQQRKCSAELGIPEQLEAERALKGNYGRHVAISMTYEEAKL